MAKSKKPRRKYRQTWSPQGLYIPDAVVEEIHRIVRNVELAAELSLPRGTIADADVDCIRDFMNLAGVALITRPWLDDEYRRQAAAVVKTGVEAFRALLGRVLAGESRECPPDELAQIQDAVAVAGELIHYSLQNEPRRFVREYIALKNLEGGGQPRTLADVAARLARTQ